MRVLGIDCGTEYTGYGVVDLLPDGGLRCLACGAIQLSLREPLPARLSRIYEQLSQLILAHQPDQVAIEEVFYAVNAKSALKLGQVRGVAMPQRLVRLPVEAPSQATPNRVDKNKYAARTTSAAA